MKTVSEARHSDVTEEEMRVRELLLCAWDVKGSNLLYSLGQEQRFYFRWWTVDVTQTQMWWEDILKTTTESRCRGGLATVSEED